MQILAIFKAVPIPKSWSNFLVASNGASSLNGNSSNLSFYEDRKRLNNIRELSSVILIGGKTLRNYPYHKLDKTILVSSVEEKSKFPNIQIFNFSPEKLLEYASTNYSPPFLIEGGINFICPLIQIKYIETIFLSRSKAIGDDNFFDEELFKKNYRQVDNFEFCEGTLETWNFL